MSTEDINPSPKVFTVVPSDTVDFAKEVRQLYIGTTGDVVVVNQDGTTCKFVGVLAGSLLGPFFIKRVNATQTTATNIVAFN